MVHHTGDEDVLVGSGTGNGFVSKIIRYKGKAAHAAGAPHLGVNALNAATLGLSALAFQRETFQDKDSVRVHPIITKGGNLVNVVPDEVVIETLVRAANIDAIVDADEKTSRAFTAGAYAIGSDYEITTLPGYLPNLAEEANPAVLAAAEAATAGTSYKVTKADTGLHSGGSTDVGDLKHIQPVLTFNTGGKVSGLHSVDFKGWRCGGEKDRGGLSADLYQRRICKIHGFDEPCGKIKNGYGVHQIAGRRRIPSPFCILPDVFDSLPCMVLKRENGMDIV